jgi:predicted nucleic acid-binding protein
LSFISRLAGTGPVVTHVVVAAEVLTGARDKREQAMIDSFLGQFTILSSDEADGLAALNLYRAFRLSHGVDWPDCQIAATAVRLGAELFTINMKHFAPFPNLRVTRPY